MIRWSGLVAFGVIVGIVAVFNLLFLDGIVERVVEGQASMTVGARVDIGDLDLGLLDLRVDIRDLEVTNPDEPMRNAVEARTLAFDLAALPLLRKKVVIQRMEITDLAWDTPRRTSGALPPRLKRRLEKRMDLSKMGDKAQDRLEDCVLPDLSPLKELQKGLPRDLLAGAELPSSSFLETYRQRVSKTQESWEQRLSNLPSPEHIKAQLTALRDLTDKRPKDLSKLPIYLAEIRDLQQRLTDLKTSLTEAQKSFQAEIQGLKTSLDGAKELKDKDFKVLWSKLGIRLPSSQDLICVLLGRDLATKVNRAMAWYRKIRRFISKAKPQAEVKPRLEGADIRFPLLHGHPTFLVEVAKLSARPDVKSEPGGFAFSRLAGEVRGFTSHPVIYGKPLVFQLEGDVVGDKAKAVTLSGQLDSRQEPTDDRINLIIRGFRLKHSEEASTDDRQLSLVSALLDVDADLRIRGESLGGKVHLDIQKPEVKVGPEADLLANVFRNLGNFDVTLSIDGTLDKPVMGLTSSATGSLSKTLQNALQAELGGTRETLRKAINSRFDRELRVANDETETLEKRILNELSSRLNLAGTFSSEKPEEEKTPLEKLGEGILAF
jgi:uncharacterized protein (TIGR03545 family)